MIFYKKHQYLVKKGILTGDYSMLDIDCLIQ
jgi:hypothetical protein